VTHVALDRLCITDLKQLGNFCGPKVMTLHLNFRCPLKKLSEVHSNVFSSVFREELVILSSFKIYSDLFQ